MELYIQIRQHEIPLTFVTWDAMKMFHVAIMLGTWFAFGSYSVWRNGQLTFRFVTKCQILQSQYECQLSPLR